MKRKNEMGKSSWYSGIVLCVILGLIIIGCGGGGSDSPTNSTTPTDTKTPTTTDTTVPPSTGSVNVGDGYLPLSIGNKWVYNVQEKETSVVSGKTTGCLLFTYTAEIVSGSGNKWVAKYEKNDSNGKVLEEGSINFEKRDGILYKDSLILLPTEENQKIPGAKTNSLFYEVGNGVFNVGIAEYTFHNDIGKMHFSAAYDNGVISSWKGIDDEYHKGMGLFKFYSKIGGGGCTSFGCAFSDTAITGHLKSYTFNGKQQDVAMEITSEPYVTAESSMVLIENALKSLKLLLTSCTVSSESLSKSDLENILHSDLFNLFSEDDKARLQKLYTDFDSFDSNKDNLLSEEEISTSLSIPIESCVKTPFEEAKSADVLIGNTAKALCDNYNSLAKADLNRIITTSLLQLFSATDQSRLQTLANKFDAFDTENYGKGKLSEVEISDALSVPMKICATASFEEAKSADVLISNAGKALCISNNSNLTKTDLNRIITTSLLQLFSATDQSRLQTLANKFDTFDTGSYDKGKLTGDEVGKALSIPVKN